MKEVDVLCPHNRPTESDFNKHTQDSQVHIGTSSQLPSHCKWNNTYNSLESLRFYQRNVGQNMKEETTYISPYSVGLRRYFTTILGTERLKSTRLYSTHCEGTACVIKTQHIHTLALTTR